MIFRVLEALVIFGGLVFIIHQMVIPAILQRPLFSWLRKSEAQAKRELEEALQQYDETELNNKVKAVKKATQQIKKTGDTNASKH